MHTQEEINQLKMYRDNLRKFIQKQRSDIVRLDDEFNEVSGVIDKYELWKELNK